MKEQLLSPRPYGEKLGLLQCKIYGSDFCSPDLQVTEQFAFKNINKEYQQASDLRKHFVAIMLPEYFILQINFVERVFEAHAREWYLIS